MLDALIRRPRAKTELGEVRAAGANAVGCVTESSIGLSAQGVTEGTRQVTFSLKMLTRA